jgi:hypothetical protein
MIHHDVVQGTEAWLQLRAGIPTASQFHKIITPKTRKLSSQADDYLHKLCAERILGRYLEDTKAFYWAERGKQLEDVARAWYEGVHNVETTQIGFITNDDRTVGASPDRLVGEDGLLEIKCPSPQVHMGYLLDDPVSADYWLQVQGQLWIAGREWCDVVSYHDELPSTVIRVDRDIETIVMLENAILGQFLPRLEGMVVKMQERQLIPGVPEALKVLAE